MEAADQGAPDRLIGLARASHELAVAGFFVETMPVLRSLHEATRGLALMTFDGEDDVVRRWLQGRHLSRGQIMAAIDRQEQAMREEMMRNGVAPLPSTKKIMESQCGARRSSRTTVGDT